LTEPVTQKIRKAGGIADALLKICGALALAATTAAFLLFNELTQVIARDWLGITDLGLRMDAQESRLDGFDQRLPLARIARFDPTYSRMIGECRIGEVCKVRFRVRRTPYGARCDKPSVTPYVVNHGGIRHPSEFLGGAVRASESEWDNVLISFRAPVSAQPGQAIYWSEQKYDCPFGTADEPSDKIPFILLPRRE